MTTTEYTVYRFTADGVSLETPEWSSAYQVGADPLSFFIKLVGDRRAHYITPHFYVLMDTDPDALETWVDNLLANDYALLLTYQDSSGAETPSEAFVAVKPLPCNTNPYDFDN